MGNAEVIREHEEAAVAFLTAKYDWGPLKKSSLGSSLGVLAFPLLVLPWGGEAAGSMPWVPWALAAGTCGTLLLCYLGDREQLRRMLREEPRYAATRNRLLEALEGDPLLIPHHAEYPYSHLVVAYGFDGRSQHPKGAGWRLVEAGDAGRRTATELLERQERAEWAKEERYGGRR